MSKLLTIEDLRNPARKSGFDHVNSANSGPGFKTKHDRWRASSGGGHPERAAYWRGTTRHTPKEAAQDYCDRVNGQSAPPPATLKRVTKPARPEAKRRQITPREAAARKIIREETAVNPIPRVHAPVCYLVGIKMDMLAVKVGYADYNVYSRLDSLQTGSPRELILLATLPGGKVTEAVLHTKYSAANILNEWFAPTEALLAEFGLTTADYTKLIGRNNG